MRVLIAEDDAVPRLILKLTVEKFGHECLVAEDGSQAWDIYQNTSVNVIISDRMMPGLDGLELCRRIRETPGVGYTFFIFLTALGEKEQLLAGIRAGADDYLTKPFDPDELHVRLIVASRVTELHQQLTEQRAELKQLNQELFQQGRRDPLTHLGNRLRLMEDLATIAGQAERYGKRYCMILCDVDCFKSYNDYYGHIAGDKVLHDIGQTIAQTCRDGDTAYRYGGEEFLVILPEQSPANAAIAAERVRHMIETLAIPHATKASTGRVTISAGVAMLKPSDYQTMHHWLKRADEALYRAKREGRNRIVLDTGSCDNSTNG